MGDRGVGNRAGQDHKCSKHHKGKGAKHSRPLSAALPPLTPPETGGEQYSSRFANANKKMARVTNHGPSKA
jgi:hypothetical protein